MPETKTTKKDSGSSSSSKKTEYSTGSVNVDSIKHVLNTIVDHVGIPEETVKVELKNAISRLHSSGDPVEAKKKEDEKAAKDSGE